MAYNEDEETFEATARFKATGSSFVEEVAYDVDEHELLVVLNRGPYLYKGVPADRFRDFEKAHSRGQFYNNWIRRKGFASVEASWATEIVDKDSIPATDLTSVGGSVGPHLSWSGQSLTTLNSANQSTASFVQAFEDPAKFKHVVHFTVEGTDDVKTTTVEAGEDVSESMDDVSARLDALGLGHRILGVYVAVE